MIDIALQGWLVEIKLGVSVGASAGQQRILGDIYLGSKSFQLLAQVSAYTEYPTSCLIEN